MDATLSAGGAAIYDYRLLHRGMPNQVCIMPKEPCSTQKSPDMRMPQSSRERPVLQYIYHTASYREKKNFGERYLFPRDLAAPPAGLTSGVPC